MSVEIKYKGNTIASANTDTTKTLKTSGKYCEADIEVVNTQDGGGSPVIQPLSVTENGTYTAPSGVDGYSPVTVNVSGGRPSPLPSGYTQYEYLESSGTQYIDIGVAATPNTKVKINGILKHGVSQGRYVALFGCANPFFTISTNGAITDLFNTNGYYYVGDVQNKVFQFINAKDVGHILSVDDVKVYDGTGFELKVYTPPTPVNYTADPNVTMFAFARNNGAGVAERLSKSQIFRLEVYEGENKVAEMIPAMRNIDSVLGMYDIVRNIFLTNAGTGTFTGGALE